MNATKGEPDAPSQTVEQITLHVFRAGGLMVVLRENKYERVYDLPTCLCKGTLSLEDAERTLLSMFFDKVDVVRIEQRDDGGLSCFVRNTKSKHGVTVFFGTRRNIGEFPLTERAKRAFFPE